jgi:hypothetical protein
MDSYLIKKLFRQDLQDFTGFYFIISSFLKKLEILNPPAAESNILLKSSGRGSKPIIIVIYFWHNFNKKI